MSEEIRNPSPTEVRSIFSVTYNFYLKWIAVKLVDWDLVISESREIEGKYPYELTRKILVEIVNILEANQMKGSV